MLTFTCFPPVFARLGTMLHIPLTLMLVGIVLRGSAFTFRTYDDERDAVQRRWGRIFAGASLVTPLLLGVCVGAIAAGRVGPLRPAATFAQSFVEPWLTPFSVAVGLMTLALFAHLAAVFLTLETDDPELVEDFRVRALWSGAAVFAAAFGALLIAPEHAPLHRRRPGPLTLGRAVSSGHRRGGRRGTGGALVEALPSGASRRRRAGLADRVGMGARAVSVPGPARPHDRRRGGTGRDAPTGAGRFWASGRWCWCRR